MRPEVISFAGGLPAPQRSTSRGSRGVRPVLAGPHAIRALQYSRDRGDPSYAGGWPRSCRRAACRSRRDDLLITTGSQQALGLIATPVQPWRRVLVEEPTYLAALQAFQLADYAPVASRATRRADPGGADRDRARATGARRLPDPDLPEPDRPHHARRARRRSPRPPRQAGLWLVEDDPYSALRLEGEPVDLLAAHPAARDRTIVVQTLQGPLAGPAHRLLRAPAALAARSPWPSRPPTCTPRPSPRWPRQRCWPRHDLGDAHPGLGAHYRPRRDALLAGLEEHLPAGSRGHEPEGGLFTGSLPDGSTPGRSSPGRSSAAWRSSPAGFYAASRPRDAAGVLRHRDAGRAARGSRSTRRGDRRVGTRHDGTTTPKHGPGSDAMRERDEEVPRSRRPGRTRGRWRRVSSARGGPRVPVVGMGTWQTLDVRGHRDDVVHAALDAGSTFSIPRRCTARRSGCSRRASRAAATKRSSRTSCGRPTTPRPSARPSARCSGSAASTSTRSTTWSGRPPGSRSSSG